MIYLILAALVYITITLRAVLRARPMPRWMEEEEEDMNSTITGPQVAAHYPKGK